MNENTVKLVLLLFGGTIYMYLLREDNFSVFSYY